MWGARRERWVTVLSAIGFALWGAFFVNLLRELRELTVFWPPFLTFLVGSGFSAGIVYFSYWLRHEDSLGPEGVRKTVLWGIGGGGFLMGLQVALLLLWLSEGRAGGEPLTQVLVTGSVGMTTGVLIGYSFHRAQADAIRAQQRRDALSFLNSTLRHELLNSLNIIQGRVARVSSEVANNEEIPADAIRNSIDLIEERSAEMADVIQNSGVFAETFSGDKQTYSVALRPVLEDRIAEIREAYPTAEVTSDISDDVSVVANDTVTHVFDNLLENAIEHNDEERPRVHVEVELTEDDVFVDVADNGPGIPDSEREAVFERDTGEDHGFGLFLTKTLVEFYDGSIQILDNDPEGTIFRVRFQRAE